MNESKLTNEQKQTIISEYMQNLSEAAVRQANIFLINDVDGKNRDSIEKAAIEFARMFGVFDKLTQAEVKGEE